MDKDGCFCGFVIECGKLYVDVATFGSGDACAITFTFGNGVALISEVDAIIIDDTCRFFILKYSACGLVESDSFSRVENSVLEGKTNVGLEFLVRINELLVRFRCRFCTLRWIIVFRLEAAQHVRQNRGETDIAIEIGISQAKRQSTFYRNNIFSTRHALE